MKPSIFVISCCILLTSIALLCLSSSIFDFIVTSKMYYTVPDQRILLDSQLSWWFFGVSTTSLFLSLAVFVRDKAPERIQDIPKYHPFVFSLVHGILLSVVCIGSAYCCFLAVQSSQEVGKFAYNATPKQFQLASMWYYIRLRIASVLFALVSVLSICVLSIRYLEIQCRYGAFTQLPQKNDISLKTTFFT